MPQIRAIKLSRYYLKPLNRCPKPTLSPFTFPDITFAPYKIHFTPVTTEQLYELYQQFPSVQTDTRKLKKGDLFFALSGPNFNGNLFAKKALDAGAAYAIVDEEIHSPDGKIIQVHNVLESLQMLAKFHRKSFDIPFIAITGSNGKTTTKELVSAVLATQYKTYTTEGNLNNHIGVPLTLLRIKPDAEMAVVEMGANHQKEIEGYCHYTGPTHGIITNCGKAHLEGFGGMEGVRKGKGEMFDFIRLHGGTVFLFSDYDYLLEMSNDIDKVVTYGTNNAATTGNALPSDTFLKVQLTSSVQAVVNTQLVGDYNLPNVLCAVAVGRHFNISLNKIVGAIESYVPGNSRSQMIVKGSNHIILDAYNANPSSLKAAIENIAKMDAPNKILMIGGMMEMGEDSMAEHEAIVDLINQFDWKTVVLVGGDFGRVKHPFLYFQNSTEAANWAAKQGFENSHILIKGSRSVRMEVIMEEL